jgi:multidrug transporter EmrE-like cation transporter
VFGTAGQLLLKAGTNAIGRFAFESANILPIGAQLVGSPYIAGGVACYVLSLVIWIMALSRVEVSIAYPLVSIGYALNAVAAWYLLGEGVTPMRLLGIAIVIVGVIVIARS